MLHYDTEAGENRSLGDAAPIGKSQNMRACIMFVICHLSDCCMFKFSRVARSHPNKKIERFLKADFDF